MSCPFELGAERNRAGERVCWACAKDLPPRRSRWCGDVCLARYWENHGWASARAAALERDKHACVRCGACAPPKPEHPSSDLDGQAYRDAWRAYHDAYREWQCKCPRLEVNHIDPRRGRGYTNGCWHHLENLEVLCVPCHSKETARQRREAKADDRRMVRLWAVSQWGGGQLRRGQTLYATLAAAEIAEPKVSWRGCKQRRTFAPFDLRAGDFAPHGMHADRVISLVTRSKPALPYGPPEAFADLFGT